MHRTRLQQTENGAMDIEHDLLNEHSKSLTLKIAAWIGTDAERLKCFMDVFLGGDPLIAQRGAWVIGKIADDRPDMFIPHLKKLISAMKKPGVHDAVKRNITRLLQTIEIPRRMEGTIVSLCFDFLASPNESIAVKVYSMSVIARFCAKEPDLEKELRLLVARQLPDATGAFRARAKHVLKITEARPVTEQ